MQAEDRWRAASYSERLGALKQILWFVSRHRHEAKVRRRGAVSGQISLSSLSGEEEESQGLEGKEDFYQGSKHPAVRLYTLWYSSIPFSYSAQQYSCSVAFTVCHLKTWICNTCSCLKYSPGMLRQEGCDFEASLGYIDFVTNNNNNNNKQQQAITTIINTNKRKQMFVKQMNEWSCHRLGHILGCFTDGSTDVGKTFGVLKSG